MRFLLLPFSWIYGAVIYLRNRLYDWEIFKSKSFDIPLIVIGNIALGGTGKTPHTEYIIDLLKPNYRIAVLSRGYGRKTKGFILAHPNTSPEEIGDEPFQMYSKNPEIHFAVCEDRITGINNLLKISNPPQVILLDDAFQHRKIKAELNLVLTEFNRPFFKDYMIPTGRLRGNKKEIKRAQVIVVTKTPTETNLQEMSTFKENISATETYFSSINYGTPKTFFLNKSKTQITNKIIVVTGIANPKPFLNYLVENHEIIEHFSFRDHHQFSTTDVNNIIEKSLKFGNGQLSIVCTEKDYVKLKKLTTDKDPFFYIPISVKFLNNDQEKFDKKVLKYINNQL